MAPFQSDSSARQTYDLIPPERSLQKATHRPGGRRARDIEDAEFEVVSAAPRTRAHATFNDNRTGGDRQRTQTASRGHFGTGTAAQQKSDPSSSPSRLPQYGLAGLAATFLLTLGIAAYFNLGAFAAAEGGLIITDIHQSPIDSNGLRVMELSGIVENRSHEALPLPALIAQMKSETGAVNQSAVSLGDGLLAAGETARFKLRIPSPGGKRQEVSISFAPKGV
ncbi:hypothetical protein [Rhizobium sp. C1]|uniref:hypothetical protein n=1 Tax=Rhizobium sp. C1 TaxID=1349799 RepID=UPI001E55EC31|nr:hypothetical protein [Rhizobium sp. C1]MCD2178388.1 hypothetical protein [Rhizobium sp. C1]